MAEFVTVGDADEVPEGEAKAFDVSGAEIAVARVDGQLYAFSDICTHRHCNLAIGRRDRRHHDRVRVPRQPVRHEDRGGP